MVVVLFSVLCIWIRMCVYMCERIKQIGVYICVFKNTNLAKDVLLRGEDGSSEQVLHGTEIEHKVANGNTDAVRFLRAAPRARERFR